MNVVFVALVVLELLASDAQRSRGTDSLVEVFSNSEILVIHYQLLIMTSRELTRKYLPQ